MTINLTTQDAAVLYGTLATIRQSFVDAEKSGAMLSEDSTIARRMVDELFAKIDAGLPETTRVVFSSAAALTCASL